MSILGYSTSMSLDTSLSGHEFTCLGDTFLKNNACRNYNSSIEIDNDVNSRKSYDIMCYKIIVPDKVIEVTFTDFEKEKLVCHEEDTFDLRKGLYLAIAKHMYKDRYTLEGIEAKAVEIGYTKKYVKMVDKAIKDHNKLEELEKRVLEEEELERKKAHEKRMKNDTKKREHKIEMQKEAYLRAMREFQEEKALASFE